MNRKHERLTILLIGLGFLCSIITGFFLWQLSDIPFGFLFHFILYLFVGSLLILFLSGVVFCFRSTRLWMRIMAAVPILLSILIIVLTVIISTDFRVLYFMSLSPTPTKAEWIEDLHHLRAQMAEKHLDLYALVSKAEIDDTVKAIEKRIPRLSDSEIIMEFFRLSAMPNDAHTFPSIMIPCFNLHTFPIQVYELEDGWTIVNAGREYKDLIGARVMKIGSKAIDDIYKTYPLFLATESEYSYKQRFPYMCFMAEWLVYHGIIDEIRRAEFTLLKKSGDEVVLSIPSIKFYPHFLWSNIFTIDNHLAPVFTNPREDFYRFDLMKKSRTLYVQFNKCVNQPGRETVDAFALRLEDFVRNQNFERCVIDIRNNDGGDRVWYELVRLLRDNDKINQRGRLFVLISRSTFSSAVSFANQLQMQSNAVFIGEPTGQGPIFFGGPKLIELPHSRLVFAVSSHLSVSGLPFDKRDSIIPDIPVGYSSHDFITGRDPVLETALSIKIPKRKVKRLPMDVMKRYTGRYLLNPVQVMEVKLKNASLHASFTDFLPTSLQRFQSELFPETEESFSTRISDMKIQFSRPGLSGPHSLNLIWQGETTIFEPAPTTYILATELFAQGEIEAGCMAIQKDRDIYLKHIPYLENILNTMGYNLMQKDDLKSALQIFKLNTELYPESFNTYDSYGEALLKSGDREGAIKNYRQSLILNPDSQSGKHALQKLGVEIN
jgi:hypothetical protein